MRNLRSEQEIMKNWKGDPSKPLVSISCITYNHEPYIEDALEGFLIQETDFSFEILIHDDASIDRTADIIREYKAKYRNLITHIEAEPGHESDVNASVPAIESVEQQDLKPNELIADSLYGSDDNCAIAQEHGIELIIDKEMRMAKRRLYEKSDHFRDRYR